MDLWIYATEIAFAACAGTVAGEVLSGPVTDQPVNHRPFTWIRTYMGLGSIGLMVGSFYFYGLLRGFAAIGVAILLGALLYSLVGRAIPRPFAAILYSVAAIVLLIVHAVLYASR